MQHAQLRSFFGCGFKACKLNLSFMSLHIYAYISMYVYKYINIFVHIYICDTKINNNRDVLI